MNRESSLITARTVWQIWEGKSLPVAEYVRTFETNLEALEFSERNSDRELYIVPVTKH
jgi:hypothetical protein